MIPIIEVYDKRVNRIIFTVAAYIFLDPDDYKEEVLPKLKALKPKTFTQSYKMIMRLLEGEIYQNSTFAIRLRGAKHEWNW